MTDPDRKHGEVTTRRLRRRSGAYAGGMPAHAAARWADAARILAAHCRTVAGCCARCGLPVPCPDAVDATEVHHRYRPWLVPDPPEPAGIDRFPTGPRVHPGNAGRW